MYVGHNLHPYLCLPFTTDVSTLSYTSCKSLCFYHSCKSLLNVFSISSLDSYIYIGLYIGFSNTDTDYTSLTSPLRHASTASSSDGSALSRSYSYLSNSSAPTSAGPHSSGSLHLSESPEALHSKHSQDYLSSATTDLHRSVSAARLGRSISSSGSLESGRPLGLRRQSSYAELTALPPVQPDAFAPIQLDSATAQELEDEPPLTLPQPWAVERQRSTSSYGLARRPSLSRSTGLGSASYLSSSSALGRGADRLSNSVDLTRSLPRPSLSTSLSTSSSTSAFHQQSAIPPDMPKSKFVEGLVGAACIAVDVVWKVPDSQGGYITPHRSPDGSSPTSVLPLRHFIKEVLRRSRSTCSTLQTALYYIHKSRDVIRERVKGAEEAKQELIRIRASGQVDASTWNGSTLPSPPYGIHDRLTGSPSASASTSDRVAYLLQKVRDPVLCGRRMFLAALICASKFLQDRTYSNRAWAKISSLPVNEINSNEKALLEVLDYNLFVNSDLFRNWTRRLQDLAEKQDRKNQQQSSLSASALSTSPVGAVSLQQRALLGAQLAASAQRDGLERSTSEYLPSPHQGMHIKAKPQLTTSHSTSHLLPRPQLSQASRFASSNFSTLQSSSLRNFASSLGSCSDFARSMGTDDWSAGAGGDNMVA